MSIGLRFFVLGNGGGHPCTGSFSLPPVKMYHIPLLIKKRRRIEEVLDRGYHNANSILSKRKDDSRSLLSLNNTRSQRKQMFRLLVSLTHSLSFLVTFSITSQSWISYSIDHILLCFEFIFMDLSIHLNKNALLYISQRKDLLKM